MTCSALDLADDLGTAASASSMASFFDVSLDLLVVRGLDGFVRRASRSWETVLGYRPEELQGVRLHSLVHPDDLPATNESVSEVENRRPGDPVLGFTNRYRHKDGSYRILEWRAQRLADNIYGVARDVTDRVAAEQALRDAMAAAEAASRAKSDFLANMSHEIRTPLNGVIGIVDALARTGLTPAQAEMVELIRTSGDTLERLVSDILDVSKIEAGQLDLEVRPFDLDAAIAPPIDVMRLRAEDRGLSFRVIRDERARGVFLGDETRIRQVLSNLLSNAVKFTDQGGVTIHIGLDEAANGPACLSIAVEDTGVGFDADHAARLFERFNQADASITRRFGGTGLGLSICHTLVGMMGGEISARSEPGRGSRFAFSLPLARADEAQTGAAPGVATTLTRPLNILLAEDHPINQRVVQLILESQGASVTVVGDGAQAVAAFGMERFDLILMDMQMPVMDGLAATRAIRALEAAEPARGRTPLIMLSANAMEQHQREAADAGADRHVAKPITAPTLIGGIAAVLPD